MLSRVKKIDIFGAQVPAFNVAGRSIIRTWVGALISLVIFFMTFVFGLLKFEVMVTR